MIDDDRDCNSCIKHKQGVPPNAACRACADGNGGPQRLPGWVPMDVPFIRYPVLDWTQLLPDKVKDKPAMTATTLPTDAAARKAIPVYSGFIKYFPDAITAVAELSRVGNDQHNPGKPLFWDRSKSGDELDALSRHLVEAGTIDTDGIRHSTKLAWRALSNLQKELEKAAAAPSQKTLF